MTAPVSPDGHPVRPPTPDEKTAPSAAAAKLPWDGTQSPVVKEQEKLQEQAAAMINTVYTGKGGLIDEIA